MEIFKDYTSEAYELMQKADAGDAQAQYLFATYLLKNSDYSLRNDLTPETVERAISYLKKSAPQGFLAGIAAMELGDMYYYGRAVPVDYIEAVKWYRTAVQMNNPPAAYYLGECAYYGKGMPVDKEAAIEWYLKAIKGYIRALIRLGDIYRSGDFFAADPALAYKLYTLVLDEEQELYKKYHRKTTEYEESEDRIAEMEKSGEQNAPPLPEEAIGELDARVREKLKNWTT